MSARKVRKLDHKIRNAAEVITRMRDLGAVLRLHYRSGRPVWWLEPGGEVETLTAKAVIASDSVAPVGTSLFPDLACPAQTYRFVPAETQ
jgi:hypothetical protein